MRVVVFELDARWGELLRSNVERSGHTVRVVTDADRLRQSIENDDVGLVICDADAGGGRGFEVVREVQDPPPIFLCGNRPPEDPIVRDRVLSVGALRYLRKPVSLLELTDAIAELDGARAPSAAPPPLAAPPSAPKPADPAEHRLPAPDARQAAGPLEARSVALLGRLWMTHATGMLRVVDPKGAVVTVPMCAGAVSPSHWDRIRGPLRSGEFSLDPAPVHSAADWAAFGKRLYSDVCRFADSRFASTQIWRTPVCVGNGGHLDILPITSRLRRLLADADGQRTLGALLARHNLDPRAVSAELHTLVQMGLVVFHDPGERKREAITQSLGGRSQGSSPAASAHAPSQSKTGRRSSRDAEEGRAPASPMEQVVRADGSAPGVAPSRLEAEGLLARLRRAPPRGGPWVQRRLRDELRRIEGASPAVVLGVPATADAQVVRELGARMEARYRSMAEGPAVSEEVRKLARQLLDKVQAAREWMSRHVLAEDTEDMPTDPGSTAGSVAGVQTDAEEKRLFDLGRQLIAEGEWSEADRILSQAHERRIDHPGLMAALGWARFNNRSLPDAERTAEALDLLLLAEQFDAEDPDVALYLALVLEATGDREGALRRARRAAELKRGDARVTALLERLEARDPRG